MGMGSTCAMLRGGAGCVPGMLRSASCTGLTHPAQLISTSSSTATPVDCWTMVHLQRCATEGTQALELRAVVPVHDKLVSNSLFPTARWRYVAPSLSNPNYTLMRPSPHPRRLVRDLRRARGHEIKRRNWMSSRCVGGSFSGGAIQGCAMQTHRQCALNPVINSARPRTLMHHHPGPEPTPTPSICRLLWAVMGLTHMLFVRVRPDVAALETFQPLRTATWA
jgi:hypothetical protein